MRFKEILQAAKDDTKEVKPKVMKTKKEMDAQQSIDDQLAKSRVMKKVKQVTIMYIEKVHFRQLIN